MPFDLSSSSAPRFGGRDPLEEQGSSGARPWSSSGYQPRQLQLAEGISIFLHHWQPGSPRGRVLLLHGKGDHSGRFVSLAEGLAAQGWEAADLEAIVKQVWPQRELPQIWCGYSAGANWVTEYALAHPDQVQGLILISPAFRIDHYFNHFTWGLLQVLDKVLPQLALTGLYEPGQVTSLAEQQAALAADPYVCGVTRARFTAELVRSGRRCLEQAHRLELPVLVLYTSADVVVNPAGAVEFACRLPKGEVYDFPQSRHDLLHDCEAAAVQQAIGCWLERHFPPPL